MKIKSIKAREILDSRGNPTVECKVILDDGHAGMASVPSGASTGTHEALELRDGNKRRYGGKGVLKAIHNIERLIAPLLIGKDPRRQEEIDRAMIKLDGTENKSRLGGNATLAVSLSCARAGAIASKLPLYKYLAKNFRFQISDFRLPYPMMNILNGGAHAGWSADIQEFMIIPYAAKFSERVRVGSEIFHTLGEILKSRGLQTLVGDEGGYAPKLSRNEEALELIMKAIMEAGYKAGKDVFLAMDAASSEFFREGKYHLQVDGKVLGAPELYKVYADWLSRYPILSIEDPFAEDDWTSWKLFKVSSRSSRAPTQGRGAAIPPASSLRASPIDHRTSAAISKQKGKFRLLVVGDDLFTTNIKRLKTGVELGVANAILIKPNQIGTLTETMDTIRYAQKNRYKIIISHRSGETCDAFIADLAVAAGADFIKSGSLSREERLAKYNRLMEIEEEI